MVVYKTFVVLVILLNLFSSGFLEYEIRGIPQLVRVSASSGDRLSVYEDCVNLCYKDICDNKPDSRISLPIYLKLFGWKCKDDCKYNCMHMITKLTVEANKSNPRRSPKAVHQFYGKWPFYRFLGIQEPASVVFSIMNGYAHYNGLITFLANTPVWNPLYYVWKVNGILAVNSWIWSVVFHTRDLSWTEKMDYFAAMLSITWSFYVSIFRALDLNEPKNNLKRKTIMYGLLSYFVFHVLYLTLWDFDYGYNTLIGVIMGIGTVISWGIWYSKSKRQYGWKVLLCMFGILSAMLFEIADFSPIFWTFDAHSLWHFTTSFIVHLYWIFALDDSKYESSLIKGKRETPFNNV